MTDLRSDRSLPEFQLPAGAYELSDLRAVEAQLVALPPEADLDTHAQQFLADANKGVGAQQGFDPAAQPGFVQKTVKRTVDPAFRDALVDADGEPDPASVVEETIWVYDPTSAETASPAAEATAAAPSKSTAAPSKPATPAGGDAAPKQE